MEGALLQLHWRLSLHTTDRVIFTVLQNVVKSIYYKKYIFLKTKSSHSLALSNHQTKIYSCTCFEPEAITDAQRQYIYDILTFDKEKSGLHHKVSKFTKTWRGEYESNPHSNKLYVNSSENEAWFFFFFFQAYFHYCLHRVCYSKDHFHTLSLTAVQIYDFDIYLQMLKTSSCPILA